MVEAGTAWRLLDFSVCRAEAGSDLPGMLDAQMAGRIDSWAIRAEYTRLRVGGLTLYPRVPLVRNTGVDGTGRHCGTNDRYVDDLSDAETIFGRCFPNLTYVDPEIASAFRQVYSGRSVFHALRRLIRMR